MQKKIFLIGFLSLTLLMPSPKAYAQGYPTFDVAKLASKITNLVGRFQPIPQVLSRINQVKKTISQIQAVSSAVTSGDLKALGQVAGKFLNDQAFAAGKPKTDIAQAAESDSGAQDASAKVKETLFTLNDGAHASASQAATVREARKKYIKNVREEAHAEFLYHAMNGMEKSKERFDKAKEAVQAAETVQDAMNAYTMAIMAGNFERLTQISMDIAALKKKTAVYLMQMPSTGYKKPDPYTLELGGARYVEDVKEGPNVDL